MRHRRLLLALFLLVLLVFSGRLFMEFWGEADGDDRGMAGVEMLVPEHYVLRDLGERSPGDAARELAELLDQAPEEWAVGVRYRDEGAQVTLLVDLDRDRLDERRISAAGTQVRTLWEGGARERLQWGQTNGTLDPPGLAPGSRRNLYH